MKIICQKTEILKGVTTVMSAISARTTLPILGNVLLEARAGQLSFTATDLEVWIRTRVSLEIEKEGSITLPAKRLADILKELSEEEVQMTVDENQQVSLRCGKARFTLSGLSKADFPVFPERKEDRVFSLKGKVLRAMIQKTIFAVSTDSQRYVLNGVYLDVAKGKIRMVATDGRRLAMASQEAGVDKQLQFSVIIPTKAVAEVARLIGDEEDVKMSLSESQIGFSFGQTLFLARPIDGHFPNYEQVIPKAGSVKLKLSTQNLLASTRRVALLSRDRTASIKYALENGALTLSVSQAGVGEAMDEIAVDYKGESLQIAYNPEFVMDVLKHIDSPEIILELSNPLSPGIIKPAQDGDSPVHLERGEYLCVIMPMRV